MRFSLDESARKEIVGLWEESMTLVDTETRNLLDELVEIYQREQYKPLWNMTNSIAEYYVNDFKNIIESKFEEWSESDTSIASFATELEAGDDSSDEVYQAAQNLEESLKAVIDDLFKNNMEVPAVNTEVHLTKDIEEIFEEIKELVIAFEGKVDEITNDYDSKINSLSEENQIYINVSEILLAIFESYKSLFEVFNEGVANLAEHINDMGVSAVNKSQEDRERMRAEAETAGESLRDISDLFSF